MFSVCSKLSFKNVCDVAGTKVLYGGCHVGFTVTEPRFMDYLIGIIFKLSRYPCRDKW